MDTNSQIEVEAAHRSFPHKMCFKPQLIFDVNYWIKKDARPGEGIQQNKWHDLSKGWEFLQHSERPEYAIMPSKTYESFSEPGRRFDRDMQGLMKLPRIKYNFGEVQVRNESKNPPRYPTINLHKRSRDLAEERLPEDPTETTLTGTAGDIVQMKAAKKKKAGIDSFKVIWNKSPNAGPTNARFKLDFFAKFKKDKDHDPSLADFRQYVMDKIEITAGPNKGLKSSSQMQDDGYRRNPSRLFDTSWVSNDFPGPENIDAKDVIDYSFTAEQVIIDVSQSNKVIAKRGPHTATIIGKHPRKFRGVPKTLK